MQTMTIKSELLRATMRQWATGVTVVTTNHEGTLGGMTVSSFTSVSLEPPTVLVCLNKDTLCHSLVMESGVYGVSLLGVGDENLSNRFAGFDPTVTDRFEGVSVFTAETGSPLLTDAIANLDCVVKSTHDTLTHTIFIAEVIFAQVDETAEPLLYHNRRYNRLQPLE
jgi:flavin reductase (DIM6/NTAB) family NADH-FMN oxidoreductase RutF